MVYCSILFFVAEKLAARKFSLAMEDGKRNTVMEELTEKMDWKRK